MDTRTAFSDPNGAGGASSMAPPPDRLPPDVDALKRLSESLESIFYHASPPSECDFFADARLITASGKVIPVHRCVLSARSLFFKNLFGKWERIANFELKELMREYDVGCEALVTVLGYLYSGKIRAPPKGVCVCVDEECSHLACRPAVAFMAEVLYASFVFQIYELIPMFQGMLLDVLDKATADEVLMILSVANNCASKCGCLLLRAMAIVIQSDIDIITLEKALPVHVVNRITQSRIELGILSRKSYIFPDKHVKSIHRALQSDDVELVRMILKEDHTNLDDANALHYAVAYCDLKTTAELLDLGIADINQRNPRGYTVLHIAAMRKEPKIIVSLLTKGARPADLTSDGRKAIQICKRLTRAIDFYRSADEGNTTPDDRLCIEILEQAERQNPVLGEASTSLAVAGDALRTKLRCLEHRVGMARALFPTEARVVMDISQTDEPSEFQLSRINKNMARAEVDLNEAPFMVKEEHQIRLRALCRTFEIGKRFFPRCTAELNRVLEGDDSHEIVEMGDASLEDCPRKKQRRMEIDRSLSTAFIEDKEEFNLTSPSSSASVAKMLRNKGKLTLGL